jgi:hypothetical protein
MMNYRRHLTPQDGSSVTKKSKYYQKYYQDPQGKGGTSMRRNQSALCRFF